MHRASISAVVIVAGCGRLSFDPVDEASVADAPVDVAPLCDVTACPAGYTAVGGGCYRVVTAALPWLDAELACEADGGHLFVTRDDQEHFTIHGLAAGLPRVWIGWTDRRGPDDVFRWVSPNPNGVQQSTSCYFASGEPDAGDGDHCVAQNGTNSCGDHSDLDCALALPYACECDGNRAEREMVWCRLAVGDLSRVRTHAMMDPRFPMFDRALAQLHQFLALHQLHRPTLRWIFREDVALRERSLLVSTRLPRERTSLVGDMYSRAVAGAAPGVVFSVEGNDDDAVYCTIFVPASEGDAEARMINGLKVSMLASLLPVVTLDEPAWAKAARAQTPAQLAYLDDRFQRSDVSS